MSSDALAEADRPERWREVRRILNENRHELTTVAAGLYPDAHRVAGTSLLCREDWLPVVPLRLNNVALTWHNGTLLPVVNGGEATSETVRPKGPGGTRFATYAQAVAALDRPRLFENRPAYRLLNADLRSSIGLMELAAASYFDWVDTGEAVAHELAAVWSTGSDRVTFDHLALRRLIGDPCDLTRRPALPAISTLTLRRSSGDASFVLHWRDPAKVTHAGGLYQVMPAGVFQPAYAAPSSPGPDFDLWRSMVREYNEEFLGKPEDYGNDVNGRNYDRWQFYCDMTEARAAGRLATWVLGLGTDPLTLAVDILAVAVFDAGLFDSVFGGLVTENAEGRVITATPGAAGIPFRAEELNEFMTGAKPMQAAGAALLKLAWQNRVTLLG